MPDAHAARGQRTMRIFIDGDACSAEHLCRRLAGKRGAEVVRVVSIENYSTTRRRGETIVVDASPQAADIEIYNRVRQGDIVVTKDYGLASLVLGKKGKAVSPSGFVYTQNNIGMLLQQCYVNGVLRNSGGRRKKKAAKYREIEMGTYE